MKKQRYNLRDMPDTVIKLINTLTVLEEQKQGRKLNTSFVVAKAIALLGGYESCPDCSGLIDKVVFNAPPENIPENKSMWKDISRQHVTSCSWLKLAKAGMISPAVESVSKEEIKEHLDKIKTQARKEHISPVMVKLEPVIDIPVIQPIKKEIPEQIGDTIESQVPNTIIIKPKLEDKPPVADGKEKVVWEKINGVMVKKISKVGSVDASEKDDFSNPDKIKGWGSTMEQGISIPDGFEGTKNPNIAGKKVAGNSMQGKVTEKDSNIDLIQHKHNPGDPMPTKLGKARVEKFKEENVGKSLHEIEFEK